MIRTLRSRLILSHTLPLLIILLLTGISFDYLLETRLLLPIFAEELTNEAKLLAELSANQPGLWENPTTAQEYLDRIEPNLDPFVSLLDTEGILLASTDPVKSNKRGEQVEVFDQFKDVFENGVSISTDYSRQLEANVVDVLVPVLNQNGEFLGIIRLTYHLENIYQEFLTLRLLISGVLAGGILLGLAISIILAVNLGNALKQVGNAVQQIAINKEYHPIIEGDPEEIQTIYRGVNTVVTQLKDIEDKRRKLLANLVHELGRPLGGLVLAIQALQSGAARDEELSLAMLDGMEGEINVLRRLLNDLEGMHDQIVGTFELNKKPVNLSPWLKSILKVQKESAYAKELQWQEDVPEYLPAINIDSERFGQAIGNLIDNAIKFTPKGGIVSVSAEYTKKEVFIHVKDTGLGILLEEQEHIFTPFWRGVSQKRFQKGLGLGLSIARDLVIAHGGTLEASSDPGEGSIFTIMLPIHNIDI